MTRAFAPTSLAEAIEHVEAGAVPAAGCTDLLVVDTATGRRHDAVVDLLRVPELRGIEESNGVLDLGLLKQGVKLTRDVEFKSTGKGALCVGQVTTGCGCLTARSSAGSKRENRVASIAAIVTAGWATALTPSRVR